MGYLYERLLPVAGVTLLVIVTLTLGTDAVSESTTLHPDITRRLCKRVLLSGLDDRYVATPQLGGVYELQNYTWDNFPVLMMSNIYFYYNQSTRSFLFGTKKGELLGLGATANSIRGNDWINSDRKYPFRRVINRWFQVDLSQRRFSTVFVDQKAKLDLVCVDEDVRHCYSHIYYLNEVVSQETSSGELIYLNLPDEHSYHQMAEVFKDSRPVFKRVGPGGDSFLYYSATREGWIIGNDYTGHTFFMGVTSFAFQPEYILKSATWVYYNIDRLVRQPSLQLKCKEIEVGDKNESAICLNGGTFNKDTNAMGFCDCPMEYYGLKCETRRNICPSNSELTYPSAIRYVSSGEQMGSMVTFYCTAGLEPPHFLAVCKAKSSQPGASGEWMTSEVCHAPRLETTSATSATSTTRPTTRGSWKEKGDEDSDRWQHSDWEEPDWLWKVVLSVACIAQGLLPIIIWYALYKTEENSNDEILLEYDMNLSGANSEMAKEIRKLDLMKNKISDEEYGDRAVVIATDYKDKVLELADEKENQESRRRVKNISCARVFSVVLQISLWCWLPFLIFAATGCGTGNLKRCGQMSTTLGVVITMAIISAAICYVYVLLEAICSRERKYLRKLKQAEHAGKYLSLLKSTAPNVIFSAVCYHYETRTRVVYHTDGQGNMTSHLETYQERVVTATDAEVFVFNYWVDKSEGELNLDAKFAVTKIKLALVITTGDNETETAFEEAFDKFKARNEPKDVYVDFGVDRNVPGYEKRLAAISDETRKPWWMSQGYYWLATLLGVSWIYRWLFRARSGRATYTITKHMYLSSPPQNDSTIPIIPYNLNRQEAEEIAQGKIKSQEKEAEEKKAEEEKKNKESQKRRSRFSLRRSRSDAQRQPVSTYSAEGQVVLQVEK